MAACAPMAKNAPLRHTLTLSALAALLLLGACQNKKPEPPKGGPPEVG